MKINVLNDRGRSDFDSVSTFVDAVELHHIPSHTNTSGVDVLETEQGLFWRYDCYHQSSPYGWRRF